MNYPRAIDLLLYLLHFVNVR